MPIINTALTLKDLPPPPSGKIGWPWTKQNSFFPDWMNGDSEWPRISIVTPSYNQGQFIEETIRSVLLQGYPNLEYIIIDGGSTDNTLEILKKYEQYLAYWVSEPDQGQAHALNKGFRRATGQLIGWQNSDDYYHSQAFVQAAQALILLKDADIIYGATDNVDANGGFIRAYPVSPFDIHEMIPFLNMCNQSMFFKKKVFAQNNYINELLQHAMDQEFLLRLAIKGYNFHFVPKMIGYYRVHTSAKGLIQENICAKECLEIYKSLYQNIELPAGLRKKALDCIYSLCLDNFGKLRLNLFRKSIRELFLIAGLQVLGLELIIKYAVSFLGAENIKKLKSLRNNRIIE